jgi:HEPN domain-containing protein
MKQTAVQWLYSIMLRPLSQWPDDMWAQAKEMEKEQIKDAWIDGDNSDCLSEQDSSDFAEQYYNETFNIKE